ncbi:hypothetical protein INR49_007651, partial [Caranx melampygus]
MSDWEDEYDEHGAAIYKPAAKAAPVEWERPSDTGQQQNVCFGVRSVSRFGADRNCDDRSRRGRGQGRASSRVRIVEAREDSALAMESRGGTKIRELEESTGARIKINKGDYEGEVVIFGAPAAQQKAKEMIQDLVASDSSGFRN